MKKKKAEIDNSKEREMLLNYEKFVGESHGFGVGNDVLITIDAFLKQLK